MRNAGRLKLGYYPLPIEEAKNICHLLIAPHQSFAIDPCAGDGLALLESTRDVPALNAAMQTGPPQQRRAVSQPHMEAPSKRICRRGAVRSCT